MEALAANATGYLWEVFRSAPPPVRAAAEAQP